MERKLFKELFLKKKAIGLMVLDATEPNKNIADALLFFALKNRFITFERAKRSEYPIELSPFSMYQNNLKGDFDYARKNIQKGL